MQRYARFAVSIMIRKPNEKPLSLPPIKKKFNSVRFGVGKNGNQTWPGTRGGRQAKRERRIVEETGDDIGKAGRGSPGGLRQGITRITRGRRRSPTRFSLIFFLQWQADRQADRQAGRKQDEKGQKKKRRRNKIPEKQNNYKTITLSAFS